MTEPHIRKFLDLSTNHLDSLSTDWLTKQHHDMHELGMAQSLYAGAYGWFSHAHEDPDQLGTVIPDPDRPAVLTAIFEFAVNRRCDYVLFDADAPECEGLPLFED